MGEATDLNLYSYTDTFLREPLTRLSQWRIWKILLASLTHKSLENLDSKVKIHKSFHYT